MATLSIKNIPDPLLKRLKRQAATHHRSLSLEIIAYLEQVTHSVPSMPMLCWQAREPFDEPPKAFK